jgi:hypothetical protein
VGLTSDNKCKSDSYDGEVPQTPEVHLIKKHPGIDNATKLIVGKSDNPNVHQNFKATN